MEPVSIRGVVLQIHRVKDRDCYLHLLSPERGRISIFASRLLQYQHPCHSVAQPYSLVEVLVQEGNQGYRLLEGTSVAQFPHVHTDISAQSWAAQITELVQDLCLDVQDAPLLYPLLVYAYYALDQEWLPGAQIWALVQIWGLSHCGFPIQKGAWVPDGTGYRLLAFQEGRSQYHPFQFTQGAHAAICFAQESNPKQLFRVQMDPGVEQQLVHFAEMYTQLCLDRTYSRNAYVSALDATAQWAREMVQNRKSAAEQSEGARGLADCQN